MSDIIEAPTQDAIAETLLPDQEQPVEQPETEQQVETEVQEQPVEQEPIETQAEETAEDWLPSDQDKVFPDEVYSRYAERYQLSPEQAADPLLRQLLHDKINTDIFVRQQQQTLEQQEEEPEPVAEPTQTEPQLTREQYFQNLDRVIAERTDPEVAKSFHADFLRAFGVPDAEIAKTSPQQAMAFTSTASKYMLNLMNTFMDDMLGARLTQQVSQAFPGFGEMYERSSYAMAWDRVRNSDPTFANLPAYGTKEFSSKLREAAARIPGFDEMQFTDAQGKALPAMENSMRKYAMLAKISSGQNVNPELLQRAAAAGAKNARRAEVRRSAGNLGSGQSKGASTSSGSSKFQSNSDLFDDETMENYQREHGRL
jgi:hypothetical protein